MESSLPGALTFVGWGTFGSLLLLVDRRRPSWAGAALFFLFPLAGALAVVPCLWFRGPAETLTTLLPAPWGPVLCVWTVGVPVEELVQYLMFLLAVGLFRTPGTARDGALQGAATGLGFGLAENLVYGAQGGWELVLLRTFVSLPGHMVYGSVWGGYHGLEYGRGRAAGRRWVPLLALVTAIFAHGLSDTLVLTGAPGPWTYGFDILCLAFGVFLFLQWKTPAYRAP